MISRRDFPRLTDDNHRITSPATNEYNCIAWSAGDTKHWWQPRVYWPISPHPPDYGLGISVEAFRVLGFEICRDGTLEPGYIKAALYCTSSFMYTHAARQLPTGKWTSKLGKGEDIEHDAPEDLTEGVYGEVMEYMRRPIPAT